MRRTGIDVIGEVPWGTHFCQFYETSRDLIETLVPYFREGLAANEYCMWITSAPLRVEEAKAALKGAVPNLDKYIKKGQIEILDYSEWYTKTGKFSADEVLLGWTERLRAALEKGYEGLRLTGNTLWLEQADWADFTRYEKAVNDVIGRYRMLAVCTYSLEKCGAMEVIDVVANHQFALIKRQGKWEIIESSQYKEERKRAEEAVRRAKEDWERTFDSDPDLLAILDPTHRIVRVNKAMAQRLGLTPEQAVGLLCYEIAHGTSLPPEVCPHRQTCRDGGEHIAEVHEPRLGGDFIVSTTPLRDDEGKLIGSVHVARDITERKKAEDEMRRLASFPELNPNPVAEVELSGRVSYMNPAARRLFPELPEASWEHPLLAGVKTVLKEFEDGKTSVAAAEAEVGEHYYLVSFYYVADLKRVRIYAREISERKRMEQALRESEHRYRGLFETMSEGFALHEVITDDQGRPRDYRFLDVNPAFERQTDLKAADVVGRTLSEVLPEIENFWVEMYGRVALTGQPAHFEEWSRPLGRCFEVSAFRTEPGKFAAVFLDVTERRRAAEALQQQSLELQQLTQTLEERVKERTAELVEANEILESVFSNIHFLIAYMDKDFNFIRVNRAYAEADGRTPEFYVGKNHFALFPNAENEEIFRRVIETGEHYFVDEKPFEYPEHPERGVTYWDWHLHPVKGPDGRVNGLVLSLVNVTRRKSAEQDRVRLVAAAEQTGEGIAITDSRGLIKYVNPAFEKMSGEARVQLLGKNYSALLSEGGGDVDREEIEEIIRAGGSWSRHIQRKGKLGHAYELDVTLSPIRDASGKIINYLTVERDETQGVRLQQHLRQVQKMEALGTLAGGIAHDFNNILNPIFINTELVLLDAVLDGQMRGYLEIVLKAAERGRELVRQIITFSRQKEKERKAVKAEPVINEALNLLGASLPRTVEVVKKIQSEKGLVLADPTEIYQVVMNLCGNAAYAMREKGGVLEVSLAEVVVDADMVLRHPDLKPGPYLRLTVTDTGIGMAPDLMERAFDPFFTTKKPGEGSGMGLAVVHGIVRDLGGAITVYSEVGKGSTFNIFLPQVETETASLGLPAAALVSGEERILLVDDEEAQVQTMRNMLRRLGYEVVARTNAAEALALFRQDPRGFDLVISDQTMPHMTGLGLAQELLRTRPDLPIILCTGFSEMVDANGALALGVNQFLMKPFSIREMAEAVRRALEKKKTGA